jgi:hypothetical protein
VEKAGEDGTKWDYRKYIANEYTGIVQKVSIVVSSSSTAKKTEVMYLLENLSLKKTVLNKCQQR